MSWFRGTPSLRLCDLQDFGPRLRQGRQWVSGEKGLSLPHGACEARTGVRVPGCPSRVTDPRPQLNTRIDQADPRLHECALSPARVLHAVLSAAARARGKKKRGFAMWPGGALKCSRRGETF